MSCWRLLPQASRSCRSIFPDFDDEQLYQAARKWVGALMQSITYREYLPALLGPHAPSLESSWNPLLDPQIANVFSTALFRLGHSQLNGTLLRLDTSGNEIAGKHLALRDAFFAPDEIVDHGIEPLLRGLASQVAQNVDVLVSVVHAAVGHDISFDGAYGVKCCEWQPNAYNF